MLLLHGLFFIQFVTLVTCDQPDEISVRQHAEIFRQAEAALSTKVPKA